MTDRAKPTITIPEGEPPAELRIDDEIVGDGDEATIGKRVIVHYAGVVWSTGREAPTRAGTGGAPSTSASVPAR